MTVTCVSSTSSNSTTFALTSKGTRSVVVLTQETYIGTLREHFPEITLEVQAQSRGKIYVASVAGSAQQVTAGAQGESRR